MGTISAMGAVLVLDTTVTYPWAGPVISDIPAGPMVALPLHLPIIPRTSDPSDAFVITPEYDAYA